MAFMRECLMLKDKVIVVTGGAGLIGMHFTEAIVEHGGIAVVTDIIDEDMFVNKLQKSKITNKDNVCYMKLNITSSTDIKSAIASLVDKYKKVDALVNNAYPKNSRWGKSNFFNLEYNDFCENVNMHVGGYLLASQQFAKYFKSQGYGNIVSISSIQGVYAPKFDTYEHTNMDSPIEYSIIKAGICHMTKYMAKYLANTGIRVNAIAPGGILDNQPKSFLEKYRSHCTSKGMLDPSDLNGALIFLLSDMSKYVNGHVLIVDDGWGL